MSVRPDRVVHCISSDNFAGVERYVATVAPELARRGWDVQVVGGDPARMSAELGAVPHVPASTTRAVTRQLLGCGRHTLVHAHMTAAEAAAVTARAVRRFALVTTRHFAAPRGASTAGRLGARFIAHAIDRQIAISRFVAESIHEPATIILNGVPRNDEKGAPGPMVLLAQRLEHEKRTDVAIRAWSRSKLRLAGWTLTVAGTGSQAWELARLAESLGLGESVDLVGAQPDVTALMKRAGIFLATAPAEPFGLSVVEAMAAGVPVIAARGGAHLETVGAVGDRWLFPIGDERAVATKLDTLGADDMERRRYGATLQEWQRTHLSLETHVDQLERVYAEIRR